MRRRWCAGSPSSPTSTRGSGRPAEVEAFFADLGSGQRPRSRSRRRVGYQITLRLFCEYLHRRALRLAARVRASGSGRCPCRSCTSGTPWRTSPTTRAARAAAADLRRGAGAVRRRRRPGRADPGAGAQGRAGRAARRGAAQDDLRVRAAAPRGVRARPGRPAAQPARRRVTAGSGRCSCATARRRAAARRSGARC